MKHLEHIKKSLEKKLKNLLLTEKKCVKRYYQELNLLSYNNKDMVMDTWTSLETLNKIIEPENMINDNLVLNNKKQFKS